MQLLARFPLRPTRTLWRVLKVTLVATWIVATAFTFGHFWVIDATPSQAASPPRSHPTADGRFTVLVFLYADCPCSRATLAELSRTAAQCPPTVDYRIYFVDSDENDESWRSSSLYEQAARLPSATILADVRGVEAHRYGVKTSGQILAYAPDGSLAFAGGITGSRGHEGDNAGKSQLVASLKSADRQASAAPVYGCRLPALPQPLAQKVSP